MKSLNIAPPIAPDELIPAAGFYEDVANVFCIKSNSAVICFCSTVAECEIIVECKVANVARKHLNIK